MKPFRITELDHIVLNVRDIEKTVRFYTEVLGLQPERLEEFRNGKVGFPSVRINSETIIDLFPTKDSVESHANGEKTNGNLNHFCMVVGQDDFAGVVDYLNANGVAIREGPISRWGARGRATSVYFLDPEGNEIEIRCY
ncbi:MAG TPA: VOC family protein [Candidatus Binatia bacterium]|jgi:catechol 2,3-dioxygenase-like lactoylglutathione lyase family enzyme